MPRSRCWHGGGRASGRDLEKPAMPEHGDGLARLLRDVDGPVPPRPEFTEALLDRLLGELTGNPEVTASSPPPSPARPPMPSAAHPRGYDGRGWIPARRLYRFPTALATAALVLLTLVGEFLPLVPAAKPGSNGLRCLSPPSAGPQRRPRPWLPTHSWMSLRMRSPLVMPASACGGGRYALARKR